MIKDAHKRSTEKIIQAEREGERQRQSAAQLRKFPSVALVMIVILLAGMSGLMVAVVAAFKDTKAEGPKLANNDGQVMETSPATVNLPLLAAPAMDLQRLAQVSSVSVTLYVMKDGTMPPFLNASVFAEQVSPSPGQKCWLARTPRGTQPYSARRRVAWGHAARASTSRHAVCNPALVASRMTRRASAIARRSRATVTSRRWSACTL